MDGGFSLDVVITESASILQLSSSEDEPLLVRRNALLILDETLHSSMVICMEVSISNVLPVSVLTNRTPLDDCMVERPSNAFFIFRR